MGVLETDYLVIGAGASGMAFTDSLIADSDADVVMVDRRHRPGGHWQDAYPFVRLHQPSAFYGVNSRPLGNDAIDRHGANAGFYERATGAAICEYFGQVLDEHLLPSGRVRFFGMCDYVTTDGGGHRLVSRLSGEAYDVVVRRKVVDARYLETMVPATHSPSFQVDPAVRLVPVGRLVDVAEPFETYVLLGSGKTAMDACVWLLENGTEPDRIRWIRPRDAWMLDRAGQQPLEHVASIVLGFSLDLDAVAASASIDDLFHRLESMGRLLRIDQSVVPTMYRCAIVSQRELAQLRRVQDVVRLGRVLRIDPGEIVLEHGSIPTGPDHLHVDCTAAGLRVAPARPVFEPDRITLQQIRTCAPTFNAALIAYVEATREETVEQNRLCPPNPLPDIVVDWVRNLAITTFTSRTWRAEPDLDDWVERSRLNILRGMRDHIHEPAIRGALARNRENRKAANAKLQHFVPELPLAAASRTPRAQGEDPAAVA